MLRLAVFCLALLVITPLIGCGFMSSVSASGPLVTREYDISGFDGIEAGSAFEVEVTRGEGHSIAVTANESVIDDIRVEKQGSALRLDLDRGIRFAFRRVTLRARITMPELNALRLSGASRCDLSGFDSAGSVSLHLSGASRLAGDLAARDLRMGVSGASTAELSGSAESLRLEVSGASTARLEQLQVATADVDVSGASSARLSVSDSLSYDVSGASTLRYAGSPEIARANATGGSQVRSE